LSKSVFGFEDALGDEVVAEFVDGDDQVISVSGEEVVVDHEVQVAHVHHVLHVLNQGLVLDVGSLQLLHVHLLHSVLICDLHFFLSILLLLLNIFNLGFFLLGNFFNDILNFLLYFLNEIIKFIVNFILEKRRNMLLNSIQEGGAFLFNLDWFNQDFFFRFNNFWSLNKDVAPDFLTKSHVVSMDESEEGAVFSWEFWSYQE